MTPKAQEANITISRNSSGVVQIQIQDDSSRCRVLTLTLSLEDYALAITGMACIHGGVTYGDLANVGKEKEIRRRTTRISGRHGKASAIAWIMAIETGAGWEMTDSLSSQDSIRMEGDDTVVRMSRIATLTR